MNARFTFSLRGWFAWLTIVLLIAGWLIDHTNLQRKVHVLYLSSRLSALAERSRLATSLSEYQAANRAGVKVLEELIAMKDQAAYAIPGIVDCMRTPNSYSFDYSLGDTAPFALSAVGPDAIPVVVGLLTDGDPKVRERAAGCVDLMAGPDRMSISVEPLRKNDAEKLLRQVERVQK